MYPSKRGVNCGSGAGRAPAGTLGGGESPGSALRPSRCGTLHSGKIKTRRRISPLRAAGPLLGRGRGENEEPLSLPLPRSVHLLRPAITRHLRRVPGPRPEIQPGRGSRRIGATSKANTPGLEEPNESSPDEDVYGNLRLCGVAVTARSGRFPRSSGGVDTITERP